MERLVGESTAEDVFDGVISGDATEGGKVVLKPGEM